MKNILSYIVIVMVILQPFYSSFSQCSVDGGINSGGGTPPRHSEDEGAGFRRNDGQFNVSLASLQIRNLVEINETTGNTRLNEIASLVTRRGRVVFPIEVQETQSLKYDDEAILKNVREFKLHSGESFRLRDFSFIEIGGY